MNNQAMESKYHRKLNGDTGLIIGMLLLLVGVEGFVLYKILTETWEIAGDFFYLYVIFVGLMVVIEAIGCLSVRQSIKNHMFEFKYYD
ncbi:monomethylamine permease [Methanosarcina sp.]|uniref:monomethylamine permease n=1 Tax=Methanosarcina sp. TaxID=2213 RepID=UPI003C73C4AA